MKDEKCPTCGSDEQDMPYVGHINSKGEWHYCDVCGSTLCPDPWHTNDERVVAVSG
jgi:hypothetical protein